MNKNFKRKINYKKAKEKGGLSIDFSKLKNVLNTLQQEKVFRDKNKSKEDFIIIGLDENKNINAFNKRCESITGYRREEVLQKKLWDTIVPSDYVNELKNRINNLSAKPFEIPISTKKGDFVPIIWRILPIYGNNNQDICMLGIEKGKEEKLLTTKKTDFSLSNNIRSKVKVTENLKPLLEASKGLLREKEIVDQQWKKIKDYLDTLEKLKNILYREKERLLKEKISLNKSKKRFDRKFKEKIKRLDKEIAKRRYKLGLFQQKENLVKELQQKIDNLHIAIQQFSTELSKELKESTASNYEIKKWKQKLEEALEREKKLLKRIEQLEIKLDEERKLNERLQDELMQKDRSMQKKRNELEPQPFESIQRSDNNFQIMEEEVPFFPPVEENLQDDLPKEINAPAIVLKKGIIQASTPAFADMTGYQREELKNRSFFTLIPPDRLIEIRNYYLDRLKGKDIQGYETTLITKEEEYIPVKIESYTIDWKGGKAELLIINKK